MLLWVKKLDYLCNCKSEISHICYVVEGHCLQAMKIVRQFLPAAMIAVTIEGMSPALSQVVLQI